MTSTRPAPETAWDTRRRRGTVGKPGPGRQGEAYLGENTLLSERHRIARDLHDTVLKTIQRISLEAKAQAIRAITAGGTVFLPPLSPALLENIRAHLAGIRKSRDNREIAAALDIKENTVKNHIDNIYSKLQIKSRCEAISYMLRQT